MTNTRPPLIRQVSAFHFEDIFGRIFHCDDTDILEQMEEVHRVFHADHPDAEHVDDLADTIDFRHERRRVEEAVLRLTDNVNHLWNCGVAITFIPTDLFHVFHLRAAANDESLIERYQDLIVTITRPMVPRHKHRREYYGPPAEKVLLQQHGEQTRVIQVCNESNASKIDMIHTPYHKSGGSDPILE